MGDNAWILALAVAVGLAVILTVVAKGSMIHFIGFLTVFMAFMVYGGLLDTWYFIVTFTIFLIFLGLKYAGKTGEL